MSQAALEARSGFVRRNATAIAWTVAAVCITASLAGIVFQLITFNTPVISDFGSRKADAFIAFSFIALPIVGALAVSRRPNSPLGWLFLGVGATMSFWVLADGWAVETLVERQGILPFGTTMAWFGNWLWMPGWTLAGLLFLLFPTGTLPSRRWRSVAIALTAIGILDTLVLMFANGPLANYLYIGNPFGLGPQVLNPTVVKEAITLLLLIPGVPAIASLFLRLRHATGDEREQIKWITYAAVVVVLAILALTAVILLAGPSFKNSPVAQMAQTIPILIPIAAGVAVMKYRLYDIDIVINKTLVYVALAAFVTAVYVAVVVGLGTLIGRNNHPDVGLSIVATAIVAVGFQPVRERVQKLANKLVYGERATPYEVLTDFSERMAGAYATEDVLPRMARTLQEGTGATRAEVWLRVGGEFRPAASHPDAGLAAPDPVPVTGDTLPEIPGNDHVVPVLHQGELLGAVGVVMAPGEAIHAPQERLLDDLALQAGLVLRNVRLIAELRESRQRIVAASDAARRQLERNIHDGAQQQLVALAVKLRLAEAFVERDPVRARSMITELQGETTEALENLRDLARGIYPPLLADQGLVAALSAQLRKVSVPLELHTGGVVRYPQDTEAAVYFCCLEALQNISKYAQASRVDVTVTGEPGWLSFEVTDDGNGFDADRTPPGSGLTNMADRLAALGGTLAVTSNPGEGTTVRGRLPARTVDDAVGPPGAPVATG